jgi:hypothetical protein
VLVTEYLAIELKTDPASNDLSVGKVLFVLAIVLLAVATVQLDLHIQSFHVAGKTLPTDGDHERFATARHRFRAGIWKTDSWLHLCNQYNLRSTRLKSSGMVIPQGGRGVRANHPVWMLLSRRPPQVPSTSSWINSSLKPDPFLSKKITREFTKDSASLHEEFTCRVKLQLVAEETSR